MWEIIASVASSAVVVKQRAAARARELVPVALKRKLVQQVNPLFLSFDFFIFRPVPFPKFFGPIFVFSLRVCLVCFLLCVWVLNKDSIFQQDRSLCLGSFKDLDLE